MPLAYSFCWIHSCTIPGRWRSQISAHPGVPKCSHWGTEKRKCKDSETVWTPGIMFLVELECWFPYVSPSYDWEGAYIQLGLELGWEAKCPIWSSISRLGAEEKDKGCYTTNILVSLRPASELSAHSQRLWCFLRANHLLVFMWSILSIFYTCKSIEINQNGKHLLFCSYKYTKWLLWLIFPSHQELGSTPFASQHNYVLQGTRNIILLPFRLSTFFPVYLPLVECLNISRFLQLLPFTVCVIYGALSTLYSKIEVLQNSWGMSGWILDVAMALGKEKWEMTLDWRRTPKQVRFIHTSRCWCQPHLNLGSKVELLHQNTAVTSFWENIQSFLEGSKLLMSEQDLIPMSLFSFGVSAFLLWLSLHSLCTGRPWDEDISCP